MMTTSANQEMSRSGHNRRNRSSRDSPPPQILSFIPPYLRRFIAPYHGDFCATRIHHPYLIAQLMSEGFLPIATQGVLLPKLHEERCVIALPNDLHISRSTRKKAKRFRLTINECFDQVVQGCRERHGDKCWLYPPLVEAFRSMHHVSETMTTVFDAEGKTSTGRECPVRFYSVEIWNTATGALAGGELGYTVGSVYTSLTGFSAEDSAGSVQLVTLGRVLSQHGFTMWDLGMEMEYKRALGSHLLPRQKFVEHVRAVRETKGHLTLPHKQTLMEDCRDFLKQQQQEQQPNNNPVPIQRDEVSTNQEQQQQQQQQLQRCSDHHEPPEVDLHLSPPTKRHMTNSTPPAAAAVVPELGCECRIASSTI